jgi:hypothetical protein
VDYHLKMGVLVELEMLPVYHTQQPVALEVEVVQMMVVAEAVDGVVVTVVNLVVLLMQYLVVVVVVPTPYLR